MTSDAFTYFPNTLQSRRTTGNSVAHTPAIFIDFYCHLGQYGFSLNFNLNPRPLRVQVVSADCVK